MAPIDPNQLLAAFAPLLTPTGGIKNASEVPRLSSLMKKFSRKLVSRCVYCNVLMATDEDILEEFLKSGGWETIHLWIKSAKDGGNKPFLNELMNLLAKLPMTVDRLKENDSPKLINKLAKLSTTNCPILAGKAQHLVDKWKVIITGEPSSSSAKDNHKSKEKKRKSGESNSDSTKKSKKTSIDDSSLGETSGGSNDGLSSSSGGGGGIAVIKDDSNNKFERTPRPTTAKVKPGKSRLGGLVNTITTPSSSSSPTTTTTSAQINAKAGKHRKESANIDNKKLSSSPLMTISSSSSKSQNFNNNNNSSNSSESLDIISGIISSSTTMMPIIKSQTIDSALSTATTTTTTTGTAAATAAVPTPAPAPPIPSKPHILHDSTSFMDALTAPPTIAQTKKKRRTSSSVANNNISTKDTMNNDLLLSSTTTINNSLTNNSSSSSPPKVSSSSSVSSPPKPFSFYKDIIDEKVADNYSNSGDIDTMNDYQTVETNSSSSSDQQTIDRLSSTSASDGMDVDINIDIKLSADLPLSSPLSVIPSNNTSYNNNKYKSILCYVKRGVKKSVRWVDETSKKNLEVVRYFELDETERCNVTRPATGAGSFNDAKRFDMKHEAELMLLARRGGPGSGGGGSNNYDLADDHSSRVQTIGLWRLIPCDGDTYAIEYGKDSKERLIQEQKQRTSLPIIYMKGQTPDSAQEPDHEIFIESEPAKVIPLEDDNNPNNCYDFSNNDLPQPKTGEQLPARVTVPEFVPVNNINMTPQFPGPAVGVGGGGGPPGGIPPFGGQQMMPPFGGQPMMPPPADQFGRNMSSGPPPPGQPYFNNGPPPPPFQQWPPDGGPPPMSQSGPPPPNFGPPFPGPRGMGGPRTPRLPRNAQNTVCKHFARTGKCRFQPRCSFLHINNNDR